MINGSRKWKTDVGGRRKRVVEIRSGREVEVRSDLAAEYKLHENLRMLNGSSL
jgi:hypothetical protein